MNGNSDSKKASSQQELVQASNSFQLEKWLSQPSSEDPWTQLRCMISPVLDSKTESGNNARDISNNCVAPGFYLESRRDARESPNME
ncbi:hypothetical protein V8C43DRAFT_299326 [Trichoderma afarasin]